MNKKEILNSLQSVNGKVKKVDAIKAIGSATFKAPHWVSLSDYQMTLPSNYLKDLSILFANRTFLPSSAWATRYGKYTDLEGREIILEGVVAQACMTLNPRNICYVYCIFKNGQPTAHQADFKTAFDSQQNANKEVQVILDSNHLIDL